MPAIRRKCQSQSVCLDLPFENHQDWAGNFVLPLRSDPIVWKSFLSSPSVLVPGNPVNLEENGISKCTWIYPSIYCVLARQFTGILKNPKHYSDTQVYLKSTSMILGGGVYFGIRYIWAHILASHLSTFFSSLTAWVFVSFSELAFQKGHFTYIVDMYPHLLSSHKAGIEVSVGSLFGVESYLFPPKIVSLVPFNYIVLKINCKKCTSLIIISLQWNMKVFSSLSPDCLGVLIKWSFSVTWEQRM